jgi:hypothetical protein
VFRKRKTVLRGHVRGIVPGKSEEQIRLRRILALGSAHKVTHQFDIVALDQGSQHLGCQVAVTVVHLVEVFDDVSPARPAPTALKFIPAFEQAIAAADTPHDG